MFVWLYGEISFLALNYPKPCHIFRFVWLHSVSMSTTFQLLNRGLSGRKCVQASPAFKSRLSPNVMCHVIPAVWILTHKGESLEAHTRWMGVAHPQRKQFEFGFLSCPSGCIFSANFSTISLCLFFIVFSFL